MKKHQHHDRLYGQIKEIMEDLEEAGVMNLQVKVATLDGVPAEEVEKRGLKAGLTGEVMAAGIGHDGRLRLVVAIREDLSVRCLTEEQVYMSLPHQVRWRLKQSTDLDDREIMMLSQAVHQSMHYTRMTCPVMPLMPFEPLRGMLTYLSHLVVLGKNEAVYMKSLGSIMPDIAGDEDDRIALSDALNDLTHLCSTASLEEDLQRLN